MAKSLKQLRESAEAAIEQGVGNKGALLTAVPLLVELQEAVDDKALGEAGLYRPEKNEWK